LQIRWQTQEKEIMINKFDLWRRAWIGAEAHLPGLLAVFPLALVRAPLEFLAWQAADFIFCKA
jgi:hypothetical protein